MLLCDLDYSVQLMGCGLFGGNMLIVLIWCYCEEMKCIGKGNVDCCWDVLLQQLLLVYDLVQNCLIVIVVILQGLVFNVKVDIVDKFGSFGGLVGYELICVIDVKGVLVDVKGELCSWWILVDKIVWILFGNCVVVQYSVYDFLGVKGVKVNGMFIQEENLVDIVGLELVWVVYVVQEFKVKQVQQQGFFCVWLMLWVQQLLLNEVVCCLIVDICVLGLWCSNGMLVNLLVFGVIFSCKVGQLMQCSEVDQIKVWC